MTDFTPIDELTSTTSAQQPIVYDSHVHTQYCRHAAGHVEEYVMEAFMHNLKGLIFTCHSPLPIHWSPSVRMRTDELPQYIAELEDSRQLWTNLVDIRIGLECDFVPHHPEVVESVIDQYAFDYLLGSVHPQFDEYWEQYFMGNTRDFQKLYFQHLAESAETGYFDALSHPDIIRELFPDEWDLHHHLPHIQEMLDRIAATGVAMELNTSSLHREIKETCPGPHMLQEMCERHIPIVLGSDAHNSNRVGGDFVQALQTLQEVGYTEVSYYIARERQVLPIQGALLSLT